MLCNWSTSVITKLSSDFGNITMHDSTRAIIDFSNLQTQLA